MFRELRASVTLFLIFLLLTGFLYPMLILKIGQKFFPYQASGSILMIGDKSFGSPLIGQQFMSPAYFHSRPSAAGDGYDAANSSGSNLGPTSADLLKAVTGRVDEIRKGENQSLIPIDLVTSSASGLDPDISPAAAFFQAPRIASMRGLNTLKVEELVQKQVQLRTFGIFGENRVNVLLLNRALDKLTSETSPVQK